MTVLFSFQGDLPHLLHRSWRATAHKLQLPVTRRASLKDAIEALGLPHTEIGHITVHPAQPVDFSSLVLPGYHYTVFPVEIPWQVSQIGPIRPAFSGPLRFLVDVNTGKLARYLRMAGFDTAYQPDWRPLELLDQLQAGQRIVLTRNLNLLKRKQVLFGRYIRATQPQAQLHEVLNLMGISHLPKVFTRCLDCNTRLQSVAKEEVRPLLESLTKKYYDTFKICPECRKIYWSGSHIQRMQQLLPQKCRSQGNLPPA